MFFFFFFFFKQKTAYELRISDWSSDVCSSDLLFGDLSALYDGDGKADNAAMIRARLSADGELMQRILASEGYYDAVVDTRIDRGAREGGQERQRRSITAVIGVKPGKRYTLADIIIAAEPTIPPTLIAQTFPRSTQLNTISRDNR